MAFEIERQLASASIHRLLASREHEITPAQIARYYRHEKQQFFVAEERQVLVTSSPRTAIIRKIKREVELERALASEPGQQSLGYTRGLRSVESPLEKAIFSAKPNVIVGPVTVGPNHFVFELKTISPGYQQALPRVATAIEQLLAAAQQRGAVAAFLAAWRTKWTAKTACSPQYVIPKCGRHTMASA